MFYDATSLYMHLIKLQNENNNIDTEENIQRSQYTSIQHYETSSLDMSSKAVQVAKKR